MKTDLSIKNIVSATLSRSVMNPEEWLYSKIHLENNLVEFDLEENELPIFLINSQNAKTIVTSRQIIERKSSGEIISVAFENIKNVIYGDFKGQIDKSELSLFTIVDREGEKMDFQMETGKASIGLIKVINTILKLRSLNPNKYFLQE